MLTSLLIHPAEASVAFAESSSGAGTSGAAGSPAATDENGYFVTYGAFTASDSKLIPVPPYAAFTTSDAATMYLPGAKILRVQSIRTYLDRTRPMIALTFDDGPSQYTERIVELLRSYGCRATFCVLGEKVKGQADRVRMIAAQGSELVGHSWDHQSLPGLPKKGIRRELKKTNNAIQAVTGVRPIMHRPPYGAIDEKVRRVSKRQKLAILTWSFDTYDWKLRDAKKLFKRIKKRARDGQIILMHDIHGPTADAMEKTIPWLVEQGYELVTVSELFYYKGVRPKPGKVCNGAERTSVTQGNESAKGA
jgi:peptidoglycan/xylan/chitin deacetylase (PgdA/CDA1 family)